MNDVQLQFHAICFGRTGYVHECIWHGHNLGREGYCGKVSRLVMVFVV